jgi:hypothetical protein
VLPSTETNLNDGESEDFLAEILSHETWMIGERKVTGWFVCMEQKKLTLVTQQGKLIEFPHDSLSFRSKKVATELEETARRHYAQFGSFEGKSWEWDNKSYRAKIAFSAKRLWSQTPYGSNQPAFLLYLGHSEKHIEFFNPANKDHFLIENTALMVNGKKGWVGIGNGEWIAY